MADDKNLSLLVGQLQGTLTGIAQRLDRTDSHLSDQDAAREQDKAEAIHARDIRFGEVHARFSQIEQKQTETYALAVGSRKWIDEVGVPLANRVDGMVAVGIKRKWLAMGATKAWASVLAAGGVIGSGLVYIGRDSLAALLERIARALHG